MMDYARRVERTGAVRDRMTVVRVLHGVVWDLGRVEVGSLETLA